MKEEKYFVDSEDNDLVDIDELTPGEALAEMYSADSEATTFVAEFAAKFVS